MLARAFRLRPRQDDEVIDVSLLLEIFRGIEDKETRKVFKNAYEQLTHCISSTDEVKFTVGVKVLDTLFKELDRLDGNNTPNSVLFVPIKTILNDLVYLTKSMVNQSKTLVSQLRVWIGKAGLTRNSTKDSKKWLVLDLLVALMKLRFRLNQISELRQEIRGVSMFSLESHSVAARVSHAYYLGRLKLLEGEYEESMQLLSFAYDSINEDSSYTDSGKWIVFQNKKKIFLRLFPLKLVLSGQYCSIETLQMYEVLELYGDLMVTILSGEDCRLKNFLKSNARILSKLEVLQCLQHRGRRMTQIIGIKRLPRLKIGKNEFLELNEAKKIVKLSEEEQETEEDEMDRMVCVFSNLVEDGWMKGKLLQNHKRFVLATNNPFPSMKTQASFQ